MFSADIHLLDQAGVLAAAESVVRARRQADLDELRVVLHWADLHAGDPQDEPDAVPIRYGGDRLIALGGDGTPKVAELCWAELAVARRAGVIATRNLAGDALDLRHRLPLLFARVRALGVDVWLARKVASMTRALSRDGAALVDRALAAADDLSPGRLLELAEAKTIEADLEAHRARLAADAVRTGVWLSRPRPGELVDGMAEPATRRVGAKLSLEHALALDTTVDEVADVLATMPGYSDRTRDQLRAEALALLASPDRALSLLRGAEAIEDEAVDRLPKRKATLVVHLSTSALSGVDSVARCDRVGPLLLEQVSALLDHRNVELRPVIDLNGVHAISGYEHPTAVKLRTVLRTGGDVFPHCSCSSGRLDHDHVRPYDPLGPPGQTGDHNDAPLTRTHHRIKTHARGWRVDQIGLGAYRWLTPHGLCRVVTPRGTRVVEAIRADDGTPIGEIYDDWVFDVDLA
ncbi:MAG TPA: hypothetical protein VN088_20695 [Nocardioides sp.]|nr:hypothetical protein [Nocardioides sp.]